MEREPTNWAFSWLFGVAMNSLTTSAPSPAHSRYAWMRFLALAATTSLFPAIAHSATTVAQVAEAWSARASLIRDARVEWVEETIIPKHSRIKGYPNTAEPVPADDVVFSQRYSAVIKGPSLLRIERAGSEWRDDTGALSDATTSVVSVTKPGETKRLGSAPGTPTGDHPWGYIEPERGRTSDYHLKRYAPVFTFCRPFAPDVLRDDIRTGAVSANSMIQNRECVVLRIPAERGREATYWLDPEKDFVVVQAIWDFPKRQDRLAVDYVTMPGDAKVPWRPSAWSFSSWDVTSATPQLKESVTARVTRWSLNEGADDAEFELEFPPGTWVIALDDRGDRSDYLVKDADARRPIYDSELDRGATYEELLKTEPGTAGVQSRRPRVRWTLAFLACLLLIVIPLFLRWRR